MSNRFVTDILRPDSWQEWDAFIDAAQQGTVFHRSDWLAALSTDLAFLVLRNKNGTIVGGLPLVNRPIGPVRTYRLPLLSPYAGIVLDAPVPARPANQNDEQKDKAVAILGAIPRAAIVRFPLHHSNRDVRPYHWHGYKVTVSDTYLVDANRPVEEFEEGISSVQRKAIRKAQDLGLTVWTTEDVNQYLPLNAMTFARQGLASPLPDEWFRKVWVRSGLRHGTIYLAGNHPRPQAGLVVMHDRRCSYLLLGGGDPGQRNTGAGSLVVWQAIRDALDQGRSFDFEGSSLPGVERFYRSWGGRLCSVFQAEQVNSAPIALLRSWQEYRSNRRASLRVDSVS